MIKNKTTQLIFQTIYCTLAILGIIGSFGYFNGSFNGYFYLYYTNLSNYICFGVMFATLFKTIKEAKQNDVSYCSTAPNFKFLCVIMILVTFLVYNCLLAKEHTVAEYFLSPSNLLMHLILPIMFILDYILFYKHSELKWYYPLLAVVMPLIYVAFVLIRALFLSNSSLLLYPYFFLDVTTLGYGGVFLWILALLATFIALGYLIYLLDKKLGQKY
ncbi:MAG: Pr6Pr family membrane protein [Christensenellales bacterium]